MADEDCQVDHILVRRLEKMWCPFGPLGLDEASREAVFSAKPVETFLPDLESRDLAYHLGRIRFFIEELRAGRELEPIDIDNVSSGMTIYPEPVVLDGHHRFCAYVLTKRRRIPAAYSGRVDLLEYLTGKTRKCPQS